MPRKTPVDASGLDTSRLPPAGAGARLAYVTPCHQFPTGVIMPLERRLALLRWASRVAAWVVEDDYVCRNWRDVHTAWLYGLINKAGLAAEVPLSNMTMDGAMCCGKDTCHVTVRRAR